jgi:hypothetical protein
LIQKDKNSFHPPEFIDIHENLSESPSADVQILIDKIDENNDSNDEEDVELHSSSFEDILESDSNPRISRKRKRERTYARPFKKTRYRWKDKYLTEFTWLQWDVETQKASCKFRVCKVYNGLTILLIFSSWPSHKCEARLFNQHQNTLGHRRQSGKRSVEKGQKTIAQSATVDNITNAALWTRIQAVWFLANEDVSINKFTALIEAQLVDQGLNPPQSYRTSKTAWEIVFILADYFRRLLKDRVKQSPYFGIMIDETTDKSVTSQLIVYIKYLNQRESDGELEIVVEYLDLIALADKGAEQITVLFLLYIESLIK